MPQVVVNDCQLGERHREAGIDFHRFFEQGNRFGYRRWHSVPSASVVKAMFLVAYLRRASVRDRALTDYDKGLLDPMIAPRRH